MTRIFTVFDAVRMVAEWFRAGATGPGPLGVPAPARQAPAAPNQFIPGGVGSKQPTKITELGIDDLPPRMVSPSVVV